MARFWFRGKIRPRCFAESIFLSWYYISLNVCSICFNYPCFLFSFLFFLLSLFHLKYFVVLVLNKFASRIFIIIVVMCFLFFLNKLNNNCLYITIDTISALGLQSTFINFAIVESWEVKAVASHSCAFETQNGPRIAGALKTLNISVQIKSVRFICYNTNGKKRMK